MQLLPASRRARVLGGAALLAFAAIVVALVFNDGGSTELTRATSPPTTSTEMPTTTVTSTTIPVTTTVPPTIPTTTAAPRATTPTTSRPRYAPGVTRPSYTIPGPPVANPDTYGDMHWPVLYALHPLENDTGYKLMLTSLGPHSGDATVTMKSETIEFFPHETGCRTESFTYTAADRSGIGQSVSSTITVSYNC